MDIEFHYYMTYLVAARAGFTPPEAEVIAHSAQSVDDNHIKYKVTGAPKGDYFNYISQTMDILRPTQQLLRIYPIFHFIPGDPDAPTARRKDGRRDGWVTTPNSRLAGKMIDSALGSKNLYRIGVSAHGFVDTWAHQNFVGRRDAYNDLPGSGIKQLLNVGHGSAGHQPDQPALVWADPRLVDDVVDNRARFLDAAEHLFRKMALHLDPSLTEAALAAEVAQLRADLDADIGPPDHHGDKLMKAARIARYRARAGSEPYGGRALDDYLEYAWFNAAVNEEVGHFRQKIDDVLGMLADYVDQTEAFECSWKTPETFDRTDWYRFVEAVKAHQNACWDILVRENLDGLDAEGM